MIIGAEAPGPWAPGAVIPGGTPASQAAAASAIWAAASTAKKKPAKPAAVPSPVPTGPTWPGWMPWALGVGGVAAVMWFMHARKGGGGGARRNPLFAGGDEDRDAVKFYKDFHWGRKPKKFKRVKPSPRPRRLVQLGVLEAVTYSAKKGADALADYIHHFGEGGTKRPVLAADPTNRKLHIVGGGYDVRPEGITG
jgi:hypothetical protein